MDKKTAISPSLKSLEMQKTKLQSVWDEWQRVHVEYLELAKDTGDDENTMDDDLVQAVEGALDLIDEVILEREEAAVANEEDLDAPDTANKKADLLAEQSTLHQIVDTIIEDSSALIKSWTENKEVYTDKSLEMMEKQLNAIPIKEAEAAEMKARIESLDPTLAEEQRKLVSERKKSSLKYQSTLLNSLAALKVVDRSTSQHELNSVPAPSPAFNTGGSFYAKRQLPKFSGELRDYISFKRDWTATVTTRYDDATQVREVRGCVPKKIEPDIKNLSNMSEIWKVLDLEYGQVKDVVAALVKQLNRFQYSKAARSDSAKFQELYNEWNRVVQDLREYGKEEVLNSEPILDNIARKLPAKIAKEYVLACQKGETENLNDYEIMSKFMASERETQKRIARLETDAEKEYKENKDNRENQKVDEKAKEAKEKGNCMNCYKPGHFIRDCTQPITYRRGSARSSARQSSGTPSRSHATSSSSAVKCPICNIEHSFVNRKTNQSYPSTRFSVCEMFRKMVVQARVKAVTDAGGCGLCLDYTGTHTRDNCTGGAQGVPARSCDLAQLDGTVCGRIHHSMLHGGVGKVCNMAFSGQSDKKRSQVKLMEVPTLEDVEVANLENSLMQVQAVETKSGLKAVVFWDSGSNCNMVSRTFAKKAGYKGIPVQQSILTTGNEEKVWNTTAYYIRLVARDGKEHRILALEMPFITTSSNTVDVSRAVSLFKGRVSIDSIRRPAGEVDILMGIHMAGLHPMPQAVCGNLRLLKSYFGTGWLLDGSHPAIQAPGFYLSEDAVIKSNCVKGEPVIQRNKPSQVHFLKQVSVSQKTPFSFPECEELGVSNPKRCNRCLGCKQCSDPGQEMSRKDAQELKMIEQSMTLDTEKQQVTYHYPLIKDPADCLTDNKQQAIMMAQSLERKLKKNGRLGLYNEQIQDMLKRKVIREISKEEIKDWKGPVNFISHHDVMKPGSVSTKLRVVTNSSLNNNQCGTSYNDCQAKGPNSLVPLFRALITFRSYKNVVVWDLSKAYNQVKTFLEELHCRRLVWRWGNGEEEWKIYGFLAMHFGDRCAGCGLEVAKEMVADAGKDIDEETCEMIKKIYVDDGAGGGEEEVVEKLIGEESIDENGKCSYTGTVSQIFARGGFPVKVMIRSGESRPEIIQQLGGGGVLGVGWMPESDRLKFNLKVNLSEKKGKLRTEPDITPDTIHLIDETKMTRRVMVSQVYAVYDPLGLLSPITIRMKMLLQELTLADRSGVGWDEELSPELSHRCRELLRFMVNCGEFSFPRAIIPKGCVGAYELCYWWDGGVPAFCASIYSRHQKLKPAESGETHEIRLVAGKARVKPVDIKTNVETNSTPRQEMAGMLIASRLVTTVLEGLSVLPARISGFGDSQCTIAAIECETRTLNTWFANRVAEILENVEKWRKKGITVDPLHHWPGISNPADLGTKGKASYQDVLEGGLWQCGPPEISFPRETWPATRNFLRTVPEEVKPPKPVVNNALEVLQNNLHPEIKACAVRCSRINEVIGALARVITALRNKSFKEIVKDPKAEELKEARELVFQCATQDIKPLVLQGKLKSEAPFYKNGQWMVKGRVAKGIFRVLGVSELPVIPSNSPFARLVMQQAHDETHAGPKGTLWRSRTYAWVLGGRKLAAEIKKRCVKCKAREVQAVAQRMGDIPVERLTPGVSPFTYIAVDLLGPVVIKSMVKSRTSMKVWPVVFVCLGTGALHLAVSHNYGAEAFLLCYKGFVAIRGKPTKVISDRGSQLVRAQQYVGWNKNECPSGWDWTRIKNFASRQETEWEFIEPGCQWRNGVAENRVKVTKKTLSFVLGSTLIGTKPTLHYAELVSLLSSVADRVNDRPVGLRGLSDEDWLPLTVNHLILGRTNATYQDPVNELNAESYAEANSYQEELLKTWWKMWECQVFPYLLPYQKYEDSKRSKNIQQGDFCLLRYESKIRDVFKLCRVLRVHPGEDSLVRTVTIQYPAKKMKEFHTVGGKPYDLPLLEEMTVGVGRLVLIQAVEEQSEAAIDG